MKVSFFLVFIVFLILKLTATVAWSWWWVTAPLWMPVAIWLGLMLLIMGGAAIIFVFALIVALVLGNERPHFRAPQPWWKIK